MNLDDLMAVWRSQDAAPLHGVNKTLLHLALRQDEAKLQKERRRERWIIYVVSAGVVAAMAVFLAMMIYARDRKVMTGWDFAIPIVGAAAALLAGGAMYVSHRAQARREQRFGESLRDQLNRRIAQLDDAGDESPPDERAGHCADGGDLSDGHPPPRLSDQPEVHQRRRLHARHA